MSCPACELVLVLALQHAMAVRTPVGSRVVGVEEAAVWTRMQATADAELLLAVAASAECREVTA